MSETSNTMKPITMAAGIAAHWIGAAITLAAIQFIGKGDAFLPFVLGAILGSQFGAVVHFRQAGSASSFGVKVSLGLVLSVAALIFGAFVHLVVVPYPYPEISIPMAMLGGFIFPLALFGIMWDALSRKRDAQQATTPEAGTRIQFPLTVMDSDGEAVYEDERDLCQSLEDFDSSDPAEGAVVSDVTGRRFVLVMNAQTIVKYEPIDLT